VGDPGRLRQVLTNLLSNALKFSDHGSVYLRVSKVGEEAGKLHFRFEVEDSGVGISQSAKSHLFQAFSQADGSTARKFGGTGLGLSISKHLVEKMQGEIGVESEVNVGSTFWFTARFSPGAALPTSTTASDQLSVRTEFGEKRVLVAEDNLINRKITIASLAKIGLAADFAGSGSEVLLAMNLKSYDLILMDCQMPGMDGFEATIAIRAIECYSGGRIPIVAMTASALKGDKERCLAVGMDDYVTKPIAIQALLTVVIKWLEASPTR